MTLTVLTVIVTVLGLGLVGNIVLTLATIRRLRELQDSHGDQTGYQTLPKPGTPIGAFATTTVGGDPVTTTDFTTGPSLAVFLMLGCAPCKDVLAALRHSPPEAGQLVVFVSGGAPTDPGILEYLNGLPTHARPVVLPNLDTSRTAQAFGVSSYPAVVSIGDGHVLFASNRLMGAEVHA